MKQSIFLPCICCGWTLLVLFSCVSATDYGKDYTVNSKAFKKGQYDVAESEARNALENASGGSTESFVRAEILLGQVLVVQGKPFQAQDLFLSALNRTSDAGVGAMLRKHLAEIALETDQLDLAYIYIDKAFQYYKSESGRPTTASLEAMLIAARIAIRRAQLFQLEERDNSPAAESWYGEAANILDNVVAYANRITPTPTHLQARAIALKSQIILGSFSDFGSSVMRMLSDGSPQAREANALAQEALALSNQNGDSREFLIAQESAYEALRISNLYLNNEVQAKEYAEKALVAVKKIYGEFHPAVAVAHMRLSELDSITYSRGSSVFNSLLDTFGKVVLHQKIYMDQRLNPNTLQAPKVETMKLIDNIAQFSLPYIDKNPSTLIAQLAENFNLYRRNLDDPIYVQAYIVCVANRAAEIEFSEFIQAIRTLGLVYSEGSEDRKAFNEIAHDLNDWVVVGKELSYQVKQIINILRQNDTIVGATPSERLKYIVAKSQIALIADLVLNPSSNPLAQYENVLRFKTLASRYNATELRELKTVASLKPLLHNLSNQQAEQAQAYTAAGLIGLQDRRNTAISLHQHYKQLARETANSPLFNTKVLSGFQDIQSHLKPDEVVVDFVRVTELQGADRYIAFIFTHNKGPIRIDMTTQRDWIEQVSKIFKEDVQKAEDPLNDEFEHLGRYVGGEMYWDVLQAIEQFAPNSKTLCIVSDSMLGSFPLAALPYYHSGKFVIDRWKLVYLDSAHDLIPWPDEPATSPKISAFEGRTRNFVIPNVICRAGSSFAAASRGLILGFAYFETYSLCFNVSSGLFFVCADSPPVLFTPADLLGPLPGRHRSQPVPGAEKIPHPFVPA